MNFQDRPQTKLGNVAEEIVDKHLISRGLVPYKPIADKAHPFDRLCVSADKKTIFIAETKGKPARRHYPDTGINRSHYDDYIRVFEQHGMDTFLFFVDADAARIYGNFLIQELDTARVVFHKGCRIEYPLEQAGFGGVIRYFPLVAMQQIAVLSQDEIAALRQHSTRSTTYRGSVAA